MIDSRMLVLALLACAPLAHAPLTHAQAPSEAPQRSFYADRRAIGQGDVLTVIITEFSSVAASAQTRTNKGESASASILQPDTVTQAVAADFDSTFAGGGQIERSGRLLAKVAVTVTGVDERGNFLVRGEQEIEVNNERQRISLQGIVRPEDIAPDNTIASWRVSGARIEFTGKGLLAKKQAPGLLTRILSLFGE